MKTIKALIRTAMLSLAKAYTEPTTAHLQNGGGV